MSLRVPLADIIATHRLANLPVLPPVSEHRDAADYFVRGARIAADLAARLTPRKEPTR